jgi:hypothetical protein
LCSFNDKPIEAVFSNRRQAVAPARATVIEPAVAMIADKARAASATLHQSFQQVLVFFVAWRKGNILFEPNLHSLPAVTVNEPQPLRQIKGNPFFVGA